MKAHLKALQQADQQLPKGQLHTAQVFKAEVQKAQEEKKYDGLTMQEIEGAQELIDSQAAKVNTQYQHKKGIAKEVKRIIENSDLIIEVLDARDPEGSRSH